MKRTIDKDAGAVAGAAEVPAGVVPDQRRPLRELLDDSLLDELLARSRDEAGGLRLTGEGSMLGEMIRAVLERALEAELTAHLGYEKHDRDGRGGNARNGTAGKTVQTGVGPVPLRVPRDRAGTFEPVLVPKRAGRVSGGLDDMVISLYAWVIFSFRVSRGCDLWRPVVDSVADGTLAALSRLFHLSGSLPDRSPAVRWSPSARASWRRSRALSSASCLLRSRAAVSLARSDASVARCPAGTAPAEPAPSVLLRSLRIWLLMSGWV